MLFSPSVIRAGSQLTFMLFQSNISQGKQAVAVPDDVKVMARWESSYYPWNCKTGDTCCLGSHRQGLLCIVILCIAFPYALGTGEIRGDISEVR